MVISSTLRCYARGLAFDKTYGFVRFGYIARTFLAFPR